jgi:hypothetical protein
MSWYSYNGDPVNLNNPFLEMLATVPEEGAGQQQQQAAAAVPNAADGGKFRLPEFWPHAPGIWFARAELRFEVSGVVNQRLKFAYTVDALPYEALCLVADLVESPPAEEPYEVLKSRLLMAHQLSPTQKAIKLMKMPELGDRRPSQLLADLLQACPPEEQRTAFFRGSFLMRLPSEIQVHLAQVETTDLKELAQKADQLWLTHRRPGLVAAATAAGSLDGLAAVAEDGLVAAVAGKGGAKQGGQQHSKKKNKKLVTFCWVHHRFGKDARRCDNPSECQWEGN